MSFDDLSRKILEDQGPGVLLLDSFRSRKILDANSQAIALLAPQIGELRHMALDELGALELSREHSGELSGEIRTYTHPEHWLTLLGRPSSPGSEQILLILTDVTQAKFRFKHMTRLEVRWRKALESSGDGVWEIDLEKNKVYFSPIWKSMLGYSIGEIQGSLDQWDSLIHPDDLGSMKDAFQGHLAKKTLTYAHPHRVRKKDGTYLWVLDRGKVIERRDNGAPLRVVGTHTDISQLIGVQEKLTQTQAILEATTTIARIGGWELDPQANSLTWNSITREIHRIPPDYEVTIEHALSFYPETEDRELLRKSVLDCARHKTPFDMQIRLQTYDGQRIWVRARGQAEDVHGRVRRVYGTIQDITDQKTTENILRQERTLLEQANQVKIRFLSSMSHELRTPLNAILGLSQYSLSHAPDPQYQDFSQRILQSANQLLELVNNLLDYSNIESKQIALQSEVVDLTRLISGIVESMRSRAAEKKLGLTLAIDESVPAFLWTDRNRLSQIFDNLLSNGIKFTEKGSVDIHLWSTKERLYMEVKDSGIGISEEFLSQIFLPFTQHDSSDTRRFGGTGLGLSLVKQMVTLMGGTISTTSIPGKGTRFTVDLPISTPSRRDTISLAFGRSGLRMAVLGTKKAFPGSKDLQALGIEAGIEIVFDPNRSLLPKFDGIFALGRNHNSAEEIRTTYQLSPTSPVLWIGSPPQGSEESFLPLPPSDLEFFQAFASGFLNPLSNPQIAKILVGLPVLFISAPGFEQGQVRGYLESFGLWVNEMGFGSQVPNSCQDIDFRCIFIDFDGLDSFEATQFWNLYPECAKIPVIGLSQEPEVFRALGQSPWERILEKPIRRDSLLRSLYETVLVGEDLGRVTDDTGPILDYEQGLIRIEGDRELYEHMLASFVDEAPAIISNLKELCKMEVPVEDWPEEIFQKINFIIHRLKGISAGIEATNLYRGCISCERALQIRNVTQEHMDSMVNAIQQLSYAIEQIIAPGPKSRTPNSESFSLFILEDLRHGIQERLILDSTLLQDLGEALTKSPETQNLFEDFKKKVWSLQYDEASTLLDQIEDYLRGGEA